VPIVKFSLAPEKMGSWQN